MKNLVYIIGLLSFVFLFACGNKSTEQNNNELATIEDLAPPVSEASEDIDYQALADAYCKCSEHTVEINEKMKRMMEMKNPDNTELEKLYPKVDRAFKKAIECAREAKAKQTSGKVDEKILVRVLKKACRNLPASLVMKLLITDIK